MADRDNDGFLPDAGRLIGALWENSPAIMFLIRVDGADFILEAANPAERAVLGADCVGRALHEFLPRESVERVARNYRTCLERNAPYRYEESAGYYDVDGLYTYGHFVTLLVPIHDDDGRVSHLFGLTQDITELRQAHQALEKQNELLEARIQARTEELRLANEALAERNRQLQEMATQDYLTGVYTRRHVEYLAECELERSRRGGHAMSVIMVDVDAFKVINDTRGHDAGDAELKVIAQTLADDLRQMDMLGRFGGDEFMIVLPETDEAAARATAERLGQAVRDHCHTTISYGVATAMSGAHELADLIRAADQRLLATKQANRSAIRAGAATQASPER